METVEVQPKKRRKTRAEMRAERESKEAGRVVMNTGITLEQLLAFAEALKKPDIETQKKLDEAKARMELNRKNTIEVAMLEVEQKKRREDNCPHTKENGRTAWVGQVHSDGLYHPICLHCQKAATPFRPTGEMLSMSPS